MNEKWVLFDLGNVLVNIHPPAFTRTLGVSDSVARENYREMIMDLVGKYEGGSLSTEEYMRLLDLMFENQYSREKLEEAMLAVIGDPVHGMEEIVKRVSNNARLALVSNTNQLHFEYSLKSVSALRFISQYFLSYRMKIVKPHPSFYEHVLDILNVHPGNVVFIDDLEENILAAQMAGMRGVRFQSSASLERQLQNLRILDR